MLFRSRPIGVVAAGLDRPYPRRHRALHQEVAACGVVVGETPLSGAPLRWRFPARNRIIAEHGGGTVLVVSHVTPIKTMLRLALDAGTSILQRLHLDLASLSIAEFYPDGNASVRLVNQTSYLG